MFRVPLKTALAAVILTGSAALVAQEAGESPASGIRFVCTDLPAGSPPSLDLLLDPESGESVEVPLLRRAPGDYRPLPKGAVIRLGHQPADPADAFVTMALGGKPADARRLLAILVPKLDREEASYPFSMQVIDEERFRPGDFLFINLTPFEFAVSFDGKRFGIRKGAVNLHDPEDLDEPRNSPVMITFRPAGTKERWQVLARTTWRLRPTRKEVCVFHWDERQGRPALRGLTISAP
ncbi:hypothetical protein [Haloferula sp. A504]|uniref:hypothetical protein n=1 Tax=Haloferula sp. A504 TaxID=3373601 RepID=UPI0031C2C196|nr:hypothetical protein [Verrucomicrobiaceae bacterium E54]